MEGVYRSRSRDVLMGSSNASLICKLPLEATKMAVLAMNINE